MAPIDGLEICRQLKAQPQTRAIPVVFLTGRNGMDAEAEGLEAGAVDYINKPLVPALVKARVQNQLFQVLANRRLLEDDRVNTLERVVVGIAHQINTPLGNAIMAVSFLKESPNSSGPDEAVQHIERNLSQIVTIVNQLKMINRYTMDDPPRELALAEVIRVSFNISKIEAKLEVDGDESLSIVCRQNALIEVLTELFLVAGQGIQVADAPEAFHLTYHIISEREILIRGNLPSGRTSSEWLSGPLKQSLEIGTLHIRHIVVQKLLGSVQLNRNEDGSWTFDLVLPVVPRSTL